MMPETLHIHLVRVALTPSQRAALIDAIKAMANTSQWPGACPLGSVSVDSDPRLNQGDATWAWTGDGGAIVYRPAEAQKIKAMVEGFAVD
jgi:hypothetical protein